MGWKMSKEQFEENYKRLQEPGMCMDHRNKLPPKTPHHIATWNPNCGRIYIILSESETEVEIEDADRARGIPSYFRSSVT